MNPRGLLIAAVVLAALSVGVWWAKKHPESATATPAATTSTKVMDVQDSQVEQLSITRKGESATVLRREGGKWVIADPEKYSADQDAVTSIESALNPVTSDSVVEDRAGDLAKYGLNSPTLKVDVKRKDGKTDGLSFGDEVPAGSLVYATHTGDRKVYALSTSIRSSLDKSVNDLRDKRLLTFDQNKVTRVELASAKVDAEFGKNNLNDWQVVKPKPYRADSFQVEDLLHKLADAKIDLPASGTAVPNKDAAPAFASGQRAGTIKVSDASGTQTLDVRKVKDDYYAKSSVVNGSYKIPGDLGKVLEKSLDDFRTKKLFDFGFSDPTKVDVQQNGATRSYQKSGPDWKLSGKAMDAASFQALLDKLRDVAATGFTEAGFTAPSLEVTVTSQDGKRVEKASFAKGKDGYIVRRENEPALYLVDNKSVDDILKASSDVKPAVPASKK